MRLIFEQHTDLSGSGLIVKENIQDYFTSPFHFHDLYEILWVKKSYGKLYAGKKTMNFQDDDIFIFGPNFGHCLYNEKSFIEKGDKAHAVIIFFKEDLLGESFFSNPLYLKSKSLLEKSSFGLQILKGTPAVYQLFDTIIHKKGMDELITFLQLLNELANLPKEHYNILNKTQSKLKLTNKDSVRLEPVIKYVMENFRNELDSKIAAKIIHLNHAAFCRFFKKRMDQTFSQFVNSVRITHATSLLLTEDWDVLRICYECGFKNLSYFNRQFREITMQSPKAYRYTFRGSDDSLIMMNEPDMLFGKQKTKKKAV